MRSVAKMRTFEYRYVVIEQTYAEFLDPRNWTFIGRTNKRLQCIAAVESWLISLSQTDKLQFIFAGQKHAPRITKKILLKTYEWRRKRLMRQQKELEDET
jgi:hypothetical protein